MSKTTAIWIVFSLITVCVGYADDFTDCRELSRRLTRLDTAVNRDDILCVVYTEMIGSGWSPIKAVFLENGVWSEPERIMYQTGRPAVCAGPNGEFYAVWAGNGTTYFSKKVMGQPWTEPVNLATVSSWCIDLVCDPLGNLYLCSMEDRWSYKFPYFKFYDGVYWAPAVRVDRLRSVTTLSAAPGKYTGAHFVFSDYSFTKIVRVNPDLSFELHALEDIEYPYLARDALDRIHLTYRRDPMVNDLKYWYAVFPWSAPDITSAVPILPGFGEKSRHLDLRHIVVDDYFQTHRILNYYHSDSDLVTGLLEEYSPFHEGTACLFSEGMNTETQVLATTSDGDIHCIYMSQDSDGNYQTRYCRRPRTRPGIRIRLSTDLLKPGEPFKMDVILSNPGNTTVSANTVICLAGSGEYWFYPGWGSTMVETPVTMPAGFSDTWTLMDVELPEFSTEIGPFQIYATLIDPSTGSIVGDPSGNSFLMKP